MLPRPSSPIAALALAFGLAAPAMAEEAPLDGIWTTTPTGFTLSESCPPELGTVAAQIAATTSHPQSEEIVWGKTFDPSTVPAFNEAGPGQTVDWTREGATWLGLMSDHGVEAGTISMTLLAPDRIESAVRMDVASIMGGTAGLAGCELMLEFDMRHGGS